MKGGTFEFFKPEFSEMNVSVIKFPRWTKWSIFTLHVKPLDQIIQMFHPDQREGVYSTYDNCPGLKLKLKQLRSFSLTLLLLVLDVLTEVKQLNLC